MEVCFMPCLSSHAQRRRECDGHAKMRTSFESCISHNYISSKCNVTGKSKHPCLCTIAITKNNDSSTAGNIPEEIARTIQFACPSLHELCFGAECAQEGTTRRARARTHPCFLNVYISLLPSRTWLTCARLCHESELANS